jgi:hypothetical protein
VKISRERLLAVDRRSLKTIMTGGAFLAIRGEVVGLMPQLKEDLHSVRESPA